MAAPEGRPVLECSEFLEVQVCAGSAGAWKWACGVSQGAGNCAYV